MHLFVRNKAKDKQKKLCIIRYGAWGDAIMLSTVFPEFKKEGWHITLNCTEKAFDICQSDPNIDAYLVQASNEIKVEDLDEYWKKLETKFDKVVNFTGSIETSLLKSPLQSEYNWSKEKRHKVCNYNYYDQTLKWAGFPKITGKTGTVYFSKHEERWFKKFWKRHAKGKFLVIWALTGSSIHKIYPYADSVVQAIVKGIPEAIVVLVGEQNCKGIINPHKRIIDKCGDIDIRLSMILAKHADLVVSPETSVLVGSGCFDTPKVAILSHASEENLTKYYRNCYPVYENVHCYPCHKLHYNKDTCSLEKETQLPVCMALLHPKKFLEPIEKIYKKWRTLRGNPITAH
jgi:ADP-heptose:LPS heptosyltransferase